MAYHLRLRCWHPRLRCWPLRFRPWSPWLRPELRLRSRHSIPLRCTPPQEVNCHSTSQDHDCHHLSPNYKFLTFFLLSRWHPQCTEIKMCILLFMRFWSFLPISQLRNHFL
ncbi:hypothetical protein V5799_010545 [Amblyomma americanum]|uniref:Uncharacterized protein n=1 Tax=Amblyomma americanum TaxID=6943 RepID=A0AAQ4EJZ1_AMBAM